MAVMIVIESLKLAQRLLQSAKKTYMKFMSHHFDIVLYSCSKLLHPYPKLLYSCLILLHLCPKLLHPWPNCILGQFYYILIKRDSSQLWPTCNTLSKGYFKWPIFVQLDSRSVWTIKKEFYLALVNYTICLCVYCKQKR